MLKNVSSLNCYVVMYYYFSNLLLITITAPRACSLPSLNRQCSSFSL